MKLCEILPLAQVRFLELEITDFDGSMRYQTLTMDDFSERMAAHRYDQYEVTRIEVGARIDTGDGSGASPILGIAINEPAPGGVFAP